MRRHIMSQEWEDTSRITNEETWKTHCWLGEDIRVMSHESGDTSRGQSPVRCGVDMASWSHVILWHLLSRMSRHVTSHESGDTSTTHGQSKSPMRCTDRMTQHESRMRGHVMSHEWGDTGISKTVTHDESPSPMILQCRDGGMESSHSGTSTVKAKSIKYSIKRYQTNISCVPHDSLKIAERIPLYLEVLFLKGKPPKIKIRVYIPHFCFWKKEFVWITAESEWCASAPRLKPLHLPRARTSRIKKSPDKIS